MPNNSSQVRLAPNGAVYVAPIGTALPTTATMALNASFKELGYIDEDGVSISPSVELTDIMMWQSALPVKSTLDTVSVEIQFNMGQVNTDTWGLYFFVSTWVNNFGQAKLTIPSNPGSQEKALIVQWDDDELDRNRLVLPRAVLADRESLQLVRNSAALLGITFRCLDSNGNLGFLYSENPDLTPTT